MPLSLLFRGWLGPEMPWFGVAFSVISYPVEAFSPVVAEAMAFLWALSLAGELGFCSC